MQCNHPPKACIGRARWGLLIMGAMSANAIEAKTNEVGSGSLGDRFRATMGNVATPVAVVTSVGSGRPHGTTVSAFVSLSMDPPMVLISLDKRSALLQIVRTSGRFGLNVLGSGHGHVADRFARKGDDKFDGIDWCLDQGAPRIHGTTSFLVCEVDKAVTGGDHEVIFGRVHHAASDPQAPLVYHSRRYGTYQPLAG